MTHRPPPPPIHQPPEPNTPGARNRTLWMFFLFVALLGLFWWVPRRNPSASPTAALPLTDSPSNHPSSSRTRGPSGSTNRLGQATGPEPARKIDDEIARILRGDTITNVYTLSSNTTMVAVGQFPPFFRKFGTEEFETLAKVACEKEFKADPIAAEYLEILEEHPAARDSGLVYSGVYVIYNSSEDVQGRRYDQGQILLNTQRKLDEAQEISDPELRAEELRSIRWFADRKIAMARLKQQAGIDRTRRLLEHLYGDLPKAVFQRLLSIEPARYPDALPNP